MKDGMSSVKRVLFSLAAGLLFACHALGEEGFTNIFNGKDLTGWDGDPKFWKVQDVAIQGQTTAENPAKTNTFIIWRGGSVDDFELRLSYKILGENAEKWANSGIQYRSKEIEKWIVAGYQADLETHKTNSGILYEERGRGVLAKRGEKVVVDAGGKIVVSGSVGNPDEIQSAIKNDDWNEYIIIAKGNHLIHIINGRVTVDVIDDQADKRAMNGLLALQLHAGQPMVVQFKDIRLKLLKTSGGQ